MEVFARDREIDFSTLLNGFEHPAILMSPDYRIVATNRLYRETFGEIPPQGEAYCYRVSHGYDVPCDRAGEDCPLSAARRSGRRERVLHIHQTPRGREYVDVEMLPLHDRNGELAYFIEMLKPVPMAGAEMGRAEMVGDSPAFNRLVEAVTRVGPSDASVLLLGESGTGKELAALAIHQASPRRERPMVTLECAGLTEALFESELFGHVKGAFTGAMHNKQGLVEAANGGTLFLDEIGDVPLPLQVKLLRLIETGAYRPVGSRQVRRADFRLVCATHKNIFAMVQRGEFRQDLFYRINVFPIHLPTLNERREDIPVIARTLLSRIDEDGEHYLTEAALRVLRAHDYVGNIRELRNILARALVLADTALIDADVIRNCLAIDRSDKQDGTAGVGGSEWTDLRTRERDYLRSLLEYCGGDRDAAARIAGISVRSLYRKLARN